MRNRGSLSLAQLPKDGSHKEVIGNPIMTIRLRIFEHAALIRYAAKWILISAPVAAVIGSACALFLWLLDLATQAQWDEPRLLFLLPIAGVFIAAAYHWFGKDAEAGNNLIMDEIHEPG